MQSSLSIASDLAQTIIDANPFKSQNDTSLDEHASEQTPFRFDVEPSSIPVTNESVTLPIPYFPKMNGTTLLWTTLDEAGTAPEIIYTPELPEDLTEAFENIAQRWGLEQPGLKAIITAHTDENTLLSLIDRIRFGDANLTRLLNAAKAKHMAMYPDEDPNWVSFGL